jgi:hypothetical protein
MDFLGMQLPNGDPKLLEQCLLAIGIASGILSVTSLILNAVLRGQYEAQYHARLN